MFSVATQEGTQVSWPPHKENCEIVQMQNDNHAHQRYNTNAGCDGNPPSILSQVQTHYNTLHMHTVSL
jgi:hypothetical protein